MAEQASGQARDRTPSDLLRCAPLGRRQSRGVDGLGKDDRCRASPSGWWTESWCSSTVDRDWSGSANVSKRLVMLICYSSTEGVLPGDGEGAWRAISAPGAQLDGSRRTPASSPSGSPAGPSSAGGTRSPSPLTCGKGWNRLLLSRVGPHLVRILVRDLWCWRASPAVRHGTGSRNRLLASTWSKSGAFGLVRALWFRSVDAVGDTRVTGVTDVDPRRLDPAGVSAYGDGPG